MRRHARAIAGTTAGSGSARRRVHRALVAVFALVALALTAQPAAAAPPTISVTAVEPAYTTAHVKGDFNPADHDTGWTLEYSTDGVNWIPGNGGGAEANSGAQTIDTDLFELKPSTKYAVRFTANNFIDPPVTSPLPNPEFTTLAVAAPTVASVQNASAIGYTSANVEGEVVRPANPDPAFNATCQFEYITAAGFLARSEKQRIKLRATGGTYRLAFASFDGAPQETTAPIAFNATASAVQAALQALPNVGAGNVTVTGAAPVNGSATFNVNFVNALANKNVGTINVVTVEETGPGEFKPSLTTTGKAQARVVTRGLLGHDAVQELVVTAVAGTFAIGFEGAKTLPIPFDAPASAVQTAMEAMPTIGPGSVKVTDGGGGETGASPYTITFVGSLSATDVPLISTDASKLAIPGEGNVEITTDGHAEGFEGAQVTLCAGENPIGEAGKKTVKAKLTGLLRGTTYHLRLVAFNAGGSDSKEAANFTTLTAPQAQTLDPASVGTDAATLSGQVNPANGPVSYQFEWGLTAAYGNAAPATPKPLGASDESFNVVSQPISGLAAGTTYHYRIVAENTTTHEVANGEDLTFTTGSPSGPVACPNESSRVGFSANLPDCRVFELASPELNSATVSRQALATQDGSAIAFRVMDAGDNANASSSVLGFGISRRTASGWFTRTLTPPTPGPEVAFGANIAYGVSDDLTQTVYATPQKLAGASSPPGFNFYVDRGNGVTEPLTSSGPGALPPFSLYGNFTGFIGSSKDFVHMFTTPYVKEDPSDPLAGGNIYDWTYGSAKLVGILPDGTPAPAGAQFGFTTAPASQVSDDGRRVLFVARNATPPGIYLRTDRATTVDVTESQRTVDPQPVVGSSRCFSPFGDGSLFNGCPVGILPNGSQVLFLSRSELTNDANTGNLGKEGSGALGVDLGDLYSYDTSNGKLTDLTVDDNPADAETGANVQSVAGVSDDGSIIYLIAKGNLAPGAISGENNLYALRNGQFSLIATLTPGNGAGNFYATPDGLHATFESQQSLTGYDNVNPATGNRETEIFKYTYGQGLECASCRTDGTPPKGGAKYFDEAAGFGNHLRQRPMSDDGSKLFFMTTDKLVPADTNGDVSCRLAFEGSSGNQGFPLCLDVYEYTGGRPYLLSSGNTENPSLLLAVGGTGDDVFMISTVQLSEKGEGRVSAVYDARVNATVPPAAPQCQGETCRGAPTSPPPTKGIGSATFEAPGKVSISGATSVKSAKIHLRVTAPGQGTISIGGRGLKPLERKVSAAGTQTVLVALSPTANKTRKRKGTFRTKLEVLFRAANGDPSRADISLKFEAGKTAKKKGGK